MLTASRADLCICSRIVANVIQMPFKVLIGFIVISPPIDLSTRSNAVPMFAKRSGLPFVLLVKEIFYLDLVSL